MRMRDDAGHAAMIQCGKAWKRVKSHQTKLWSDWTLIIGPALMKARAEAMSIAETNRPLGRGYNTAMSELLEEYDVADMGETVRAHTLKIMEHLAEVEEWRAKQKDPNDLNHPSRVWTKYQRSAAQSDERAIERREQRKAERRATTTDELAQALERIRELEAEIGTLKEYIARLEAALAGGRPKRKYTNKLAAAVDAAIEASPVKRKRGRPKGSKNKPKPLRSDLFA